MSVIIGPYLYLIVLMVYLVIVDILLCTVYRPLKKTSLCYSAPRKGHPVADLL